MFDRKEILYKIIIIILGGCIFLCPPPPPIIRTTVKILLIKSIVLGNSNLRDSTVFHYSHNSK